MDIANAKNKLNNFSNNVKLSTEQFKSKINDVSVFRSAFNMVKSIKPLVKALICVIIIFIFIHAILFQYTELYNNKKELNRGEKFMDALYFTTTLYSSVGFGDITPQHWFSKLLTCGQQCLITACVMTTL